MKKPLPESAVKRQESVVKDSGWSWVILFVAFLAQTIIFGLVLCFGIYFVTLLQHFKCTKRDVAVVGSIAYGTKCLTGLLSSILYRKFGCRAVVMAGGLASATGCFLSFFAKDLPHLYVSYGLINGFGLGLAYTPTVGILPDYFDKYRYFATAFVSVGSGLGTLIFQPVFLLLIREFGWQGSMLINAGFALQIVVCGSLLKSRSVNSKLPWSSIAEFALVKEPRFWFHMLDCLLWGGTVYIIFSMVNVLVMSEGLTKSQSAMLASVIGLSNVCGRVTASLLGHRDKTNRPLFYATVTFLFSTAALGATTATSFATFSVWLAGFGLFFGMMLSQLAPTLIDQFGPEKLVNSIGYSMCAVGIGGIPLPLLAGSLADNFGIKTSFYFAFACGSLAAIFCFINVVLKKIEDRDRAAAVEMTLVESQPDKG